MWLLVNDVNQHIYACMHSWYYSCLRTLLSDLKHDPYLLSKEHIFLPFIKYKLQSGIFFLCWLSSSCIGSLINIHTHPSASATDIYDAVGFFFLQWDMHLSLQYTRNTKTDILYFFFVLLCLFSCSKINWSLSEEQVHVVFLSFI